MRFECPKIEDLNESNLNKRLQDKIDNKTKPQGSLGRIENLAHSIGLILGHDAPVLMDPQLVVFAGDHGLASRGVSAYPSDVTWQMVENFLAGGAAVSVLARQHGIALTVVDCGVKHDFAPRPGLLIQKIGYGTADSLETTAMTDDQCDQALKNGAELLKSLPGNALLLGEMGIGNTSAASLLMSRLTGLDIVDCTGAGTGLDAASVGRKIDILKKVLASHADSIEPLSALAAFGGFEIATMVGAVLQAAVERRVIVVDGFIASAAVLVASSLQPSVIQRCVFAHRSGERGHALMLAYMKVDPVLDLGMRLGEGSGAALVWPLLVSACAVLRDMASFESAGVSREQENISIGSPG
jgi:nicotinate-nucleotide--dimethylbenzimidazole phosphoribosyltransferase